jgi:site-specific DNA-methyltransferase (adenine-specific)
MNTVGLLDMLYGGDHGQAFSLYQGDCLKVLEVMDPESLDSLVTDPPAGIGFMGKDWDKDKGGRDSWVSWMTQVMQECHRVLKPGAHALVWAIPRTSHWTATALEDAGFEIRDVVMHLFGTGFPKSLDVSKAIDKAAGAERDVVGVNPSSRPNSKVKNGRCFDGLRDETESAGVQSLTAPSTDDAKRWQGWGTALKPAAEHWILCRKPLGEKTVAANVLKHGTGAVNVDGCRIEGGAKPLREHTANKALDNVVYGSGVLNGSKAVGETTQGRFPANLVLSCCGEEPHAEGCAVAELDGQSGISKSTAGVRNNNNQGHEDWSGGTLRAGPLYSGHADSGGASRFFYTSKASQSDRGEGNTHPTVKSRKLMAYLCRLVTPPGGTILDPFMGSGSTGVAAMIEGFLFIGIEREVESYETALRRLEGAV